MNSYDVLKTSFFVLFFSVLGPSLAHSENTSVHSSSTPVDDRLQYCDGWSAADRSLFLDRQEGVTSRSEGKDGSLFVLYETPARHDHGLPTGSCGVRIDIFKS